MPKLPPNQTPTAPGRWPVLDLGGQPDLTPERWHLRVDGACRRPLVLHWADFWALEQVEDTSDFHCVTGWSRLDVRCVITPQLWAWKGAKWIRRLVLLREDRKGFWKERGYSNTAHPWRDDRYS